MKIFLLIITFLPNFLFAETILSKTGPNLNFIFDEDYNILHCLQKGSSKNPKVVEFFNEVWQKDKNSYQILNKMKRISPQFSQENSLEPNPEQINIAVKNLLTLAKESDYYPTFKAESEKNLEQIKKDWEGLIEKSLPLMEELTGFNFEKTFTIFITHPEVGNGSNWGNGVISFGFNINPWPYYTMVYLWHEILHDYFPRDDFNHALIQLITDNELRIRLGGGVYPPLEGHQYLVTQMENLLPMVKGYWEISSPKENILEYISAIENATLDN